MAIQLCPVDTANVHPRNILGSSSSFDRERLSPFGSLSSRCWEAPAGGHGDLSPSSVQKQHGEHPARKMWLRRAVLAEVGDGAAYVPFIGSGDIPLACYPERTIYGIDLDPARVADARTVLSALAFASVIVGDCDEGWPFPGVDDTFALCDADAYAYPYGAIRAFWKHARKAEAVGLLGTDGQMRVHGLNPNFRHPDGHSVKNTSRKEQSKTEFTYWSRLIKPESTEGMTLQQQNG